MEHPKLRPIDARPLIHQGQPSILLRDPLGMSEKVLVIPQQLAPLLVLCDGSRNINALRAALTVRFGLNVRPDMLRELVAALDEALLLDNARFAAALEQARADYRAAPCRPPASAGRSYPADPAGLRRLLDDYLTAASDVQPHPAVRGLVSPHIDYPRGGPTYARVWKRAATAAQDAELVVLLGTDHNGSLGRLTLTRQHYATPLGLLPTDRQLVDELAQVIGPDAAFAEEIHHRGEHSIELAAVWLHHVRGGQPCPVLPILCGSFGHLVRGDAAPTDHSALNALVDRLQQLAAQRRTLVVAAGDLAHVGPAFDGPPQGTPEQNQLRAADDRLLQHICAGDAEGFFQAIRRDGDQANICGLPPIYIALRVLAPTSGESLAYEQCPADPAGTSWVSICGVVLE